MGAEEFEVKCGLGGEFEPPSDGWPLCDTVNPNMCSVFPTDVPAIVEIVKKEPQLPGGKIYYKCKEEGFITNLGPLVEVKAYQNLQGAGKSVTKENFQKIFCY